MAHVLKVSCVLVLFLPVLNSLYTSFLMLLAAFATKRDGVYLKLSSVFHCCSVVLIESFAVPQTLHAMQQPLLYQSFLFVAKFPGKV